MINDQHHYFIERFWTLFIEKQGGELVTFTGDIATVFQKVKTNAKAPILNFEVETSDKLEMIILRTEPVQQSIYERQIKNRS